MVILYPWATLKSGEGFFVPGLNLVEIKERGLRAAVPYPFISRAVFGIKDGMLGVWFYRKPLGYSWQALFAKHVAYRASHASGQESY